MPWYEGPDGLPKAAWARWGEAGPGVSLLAEETPPGPLISRFFAPCRVFQRSLFGRWKLVKARLRAFELLTLEHS